MHIKQQLYSLCQQFIEQRIANAQEAIDNAQESANDETKSSAGDKHETGRAMAQLEQEKGANQMREALELKNILDRINIQNLSGKIQAGSLIYTNKGNFFISIPAGKFQIDNQQYFTLSIQSPFGSKLKNFSKNDHFEFNGQSYEITDVL